MSSGDKYSSSTSKGSDGKSSSSEKVEYQLITFEDTSQKEAEAKGRYIHYDKIKSWTTAKQNETAIDPAKVDRYVKDHPAPDYITAYYQLGPRRRELLDDCYKSLNEKSSPTDLSSHWVPEHLYPGKDVTDPRTGRKIRNPKSFWVIVKRTKKTTVSKSDSSGSSNPKSILLNSSKSSDSKGYDKSNDKGYDKDKSSGSGNHNDRLLQQLIGLMTQMNTSTNGTTADMQMQNQLQQMQYQLSVLNQQQSRTPYMQPQLTPPPPYAELNMPINAHNGLPQAPIVPGSQMYNPQYMSGRMSTDNSPTFAMNGGYNSVGPHGHPNNSHGFDNSYPQRRSSSRSRYSQDDEDLLRNTHLNAQEPSSYPRMGAGSRRHGVSFGQYYPDESHHQGKMSYAQDMNGNMQQYVPRQPLTIMGNNVDALQLRRLEAWNQAASTNSDCSDEDLQGRGRGMSRADSVYSRQRSRSASARGIRTVDLSGGGRRNSISYPGMHGGGMNMGKGFGMSESDDDMPMHHGMSIDRNVTQTPFRGMRR